MYLNCGKIKGENVTHLASVGKSGMHKSYKREILQMHIHSFLYFIAFQSKLFICIFMPIFSMISYNTVVNCCL